MHIKIEIIYIYIYIYKLKNWNIIYKKNLYRLCRYVKMKFDKDRCRNVSFQSMFYDYD